MSPDRGQRRRAVVLLSGGLDSATTLALAIERGFETHALTVRYGQRHAIEVDRAETLARQLGATGTPSFFINGRNLRGAQPLPAFITVIDEELTKARDYTIGSFRLGMETPMALAQRAGEQLLLLGEIEPIDDVVARFQAVTAADVQRVAGRIFRSDNFAMSLVGPGANESELTELLAA